MLRSSCRIALVVASLLAGTAAALAGWKVQTWRDHNGVDGARVSASVDGHDLSVSCGRNTRPDAQLLLFGKSFPNLHASNDVRANLTLHFILEGGVTYDTRLGAWYYGPDSAWVGKLLVDESLLVVFEKADSMEIRSPAGKTVLTFPMNGSARAGKALRAQCGLGDR